MTLLFNDPASFVDEMVEGFVAANGRWVRSVPGGVVRRHPPSEPTVAVIIGGGSGHYPAFGGLVGSGLAHGAVIGNVFASPSADVTSPKPARLRRPISRSFLLLRPRQRSARALVALALLRYGRLRAAAGCLDARARSLAP